jgi:hypothetical protein
VNLETRKPEEMNRGKRKQEAFLSFMGPWLPDFRFFSGFSNSYVGIGR